MIRGIFRRLGLQREPPPPPRDVAALAAPLSVPAVHLVREGTPSRSHLGGTPAVPAGFAWPERDGRELAFLARLSLAELAATGAVDWLPREGALLFFYDVEEQPWGFDPKDRGGAAVRLVADLTEPIAALAPSPAEGGAPLPANLTLRRIDSLPSRMRGAVEELRLTDPESELYDDLLNRTFEGRPKHQVAGFPFPIQDDSMELECRLVTHGLYLGDPTGYQDPRVAELEPGASDWRLLLQLDTDDDLGWMWGDAGTIYFWVEASAAREGRFDDAWLVLQCG